MDTVLQTLEAIQKSMKEQSCTFGPFVEEMVEKAIAQARVEQETLAQYSELIDLIGPESVAELVSGTKIDVKKSVDKPDALPLTERESFILDGAYQHGAETDDNCDYVVMTNRGFVDFIAMVRKWDAEQILKTNAVKVQS